jgi:tRNA(Arg) A34 adenosine deaminase TadA
VIDATDLRHLERCIELATEALEAGDEPFGSILVDDEAGFDSRTVTGWRAATGPASRVRHRPLGGQEHVTSGASGGDGLHLR